MASAFRTFVVVDRPKFKVKVYHRALTFPEWKLFRAYHVAIGAIGHATPGGMTEVEWKVLNPSWTMPNSSWVNKADWGKVIPGGDPTNPLVAAFISVAADEGVGFHGTHNLDSLGSRASHGCIRMEPKDVLDLYKLVKKGTPVYIV